jgi:hypothetical protein
VTPAAYRSCTAPCMVTLPFSGGHSDTFSAPYYDYSGDIAYVGDDSGYLHKFTGVFAGTPAEVTTAWPVHLGSNQLSSPVYDSGTGNVFVGDMGGVLYSVTAATGAIYGTTGSVGDAMIDGPLVDSSAGAVYAFITTGVAPYASGRNAVLELPTNFTSLNSPSAAVFGGNPNRKPLRGWQHRHIGRGDAVPDSGLELSHGDSRQRRVRPQPEHPWVPLSGNRILQQRRERLQRQLDNDHCGHGLYLLQRQPRKRVRMQQYGGTRLYLVLQRERPIEHPDGRHRAGCHHSRHQRLLGNGRACD